MERLVDRRTGAKALKYILAEDERIQEELSAIDLTQDTITALSTSIRDSFGLYLSREASDPISGTAGEAYTSMSIDESLGAFMSMPSKLVPVEWISSGAMDQIYPALRLAAAKLV